MKFSRKEIAAYGIGAIGKDMVYALSSGFIMYYYQDLLGISAAFVGFILMIARVFDAANDPFMGVIVQKTNTKWGRFRPWVLFGTLLNAVVLIFLFSAPALEGSALRTYFAVMYILWGVTYTMMDIPYWSMIPAVTTNARDREQLSVVGRTCAGVGNALIQVGTVMSVALLGGNSEKAGFRYFAMIVAVIFVLTELFLFLSVRETKSDTKMETTTVKEMFRSLFRNDQAMVTVITIILINCALYITSTLVIYFFKYDVGGGAGWKGQYTLFTMAGGATQILGMMVCYPLLRKKFDNTQIFRLCLTTAIIGYAGLLVMSVTGLTKSLVLLLIPGVMVFASNGILTVLTTVFLSASVDYGELKTGHREESVIFSMQTFVVKAASGLAVFLAGTGIELVGFNGNSNEEAVIAVQSAGTLMGIRLLMTVIPILILVCAYFVFNKKFILTDAKSEEIAALLHGEKA